MRSSTQSRQEEIVTSQTVQTRLFYVIAVVEQRDVFLLQVESVSWSFVKNKCTCCFRLKLLSYSPPVEVNNYSISICICIYVNTQYSLKTYGAPPYADSKMFIVSFFDYPLLTC
jgi:hypothetical protein